MARLRCFTREKPSSLPPRKLDANELYIKHIKLSKATQNKNLNIDTFYFTFPKRTQSTLSPQNKKKQFYPHKKGKIAPLQKRCLLQLRELIGVQVGFPCIVPWSCGAEHSVVYDIPLFSCSVHPKNQTRSCYCAMLGLSFHTFLVFSLKIKKHRKKRNPLNSVKHTNNSLFRNPPTPPAAFNKLSLFS